MKTAFTYRTLSTFSESLYKEKGSKFFGYAFSVANEEEVKERLAEIRSKHHDARHHCYAYRLGIGGEERYRANDDGEPSNSAGKPIYGQLLSAEITNVLIVVVRYFGGVKLGVGGLISAYKIAAKKTIEANIIIEKEEFNYYQITFEYLVMSEVMNFIKIHKLTSLNQEFEEKGNLQLALSIKDSKRILGLLDEIETVEVKFLHKR